jgi:exonuclease SbcC
VIPIRLKIKGLYSYREAVEIDFTRLCAASLFGIFGPVGSGKSAILEAITYALYGDTERLNASGDNRNYNMMNLQSTEMLIEFEFKTTHQEVENRYLFRVAQKRNSKQFNDVRSPVRSALQWKQNDWEALESTDAEKVLNLSYQNFTKTIIIPQGRFQEFLHMGPTNRTRMLRELFSLDRFELDKPTKSLLITTNDQLIRLEEQLRALADAHPEEIAAKELEETELEGALKKERESAQQLETAVTLHRQRKQDADSMAQIREKLAVLEVERQQIEEREKRANLYNKTILDFREPVNQEAKLQRDREAGHQAKENVSKALTDLQPRLESARTAAQKAKEDWEGKHHIEAQIQDCKHLQEIRTATDQLATLEERLKKGDETIQKVTQDIATQEKTKTQCEAAIAQNRQQMPNLSRVNAALLWYQQKAHLQSQLDRIQEQTTQIEAQHKELLEAQAQLSSVQFLEKALTSTKQQITHARDEKAHIHQQEGLATFALDLTAGKPCPLCGADHHPAPYNPGEAATKIRAAEEKLKALETQLLATEKALTAAQSLAIRIEEKENQLARQTTEFTQQSAKITAHLQTFEWAPYNPQDPSQAEADRIAAHQLQEIIDKEEAIRLDLDKTIKKLQEDQKRFEAALNTFRDEKNRLEGQRDTHLRQRILLKDNSYLEKTAAEITVLSQDLQTRLDAILRNFTSTQEAEKAMAMKEVELRQQQTTAIATLEKLEAEWAQLQSQLTQQLTQAGFRTLDEVKAILAWNLDLQEEQKAIHAFHREVHSAKAALQTFESRAHDQPYDAETHTQAEESLTKARENIEQHQSNLSVLRATLQKLRSDWSRRKDLEQQQAIQRTRYENLKVLEGLFKASGFVKYVSTIYLQELVSRADVRFRILTRNALSLELGDESDFLVRDMLNGGQTRSVKTLSGGQTFQASLCLALALADNVQHLSGSKHNFFFLDEGFGTLDRDSLGIVFDTLKQLRQENRIVGVISHVDEMQQEIDTYLRVSQTEEKGSQVVGSWEIQ